MITLNGKKFAKNISEFTESLFNNDGLGTCVGFYKRTKCTVILMDHQQQRIGVINKHGCLCCATLQDDGRYWYSFATIKQIGEYDSYMQSVEEPRAIFNCEELVS